MSRAPRLSTPSVQKPRPGTILKGHRATFSRARPTTAWRLPRGPSLHAGRGVLDGANRGRRWRRADRTVLHVGLGHLARARDAGRSRGARTPEEQKRPVRLSAMHASPTPLRPLWREPFELTHSLRCEPWNHIRSWQLEPCDRMRSSLSEHANNLKSQQQRTQEEIPPAQITDTMVNHKQTHRCTSVHANARATRSTIPERRGRPPADAGSGATRHGVRDMTRASGAPIWKTRAQRACEPAARGRNPAAIQQPRCELHNTNTPSLRHDVWNAVPPSTLHQQHTCRWVARACKACKHKEDTADATSVRLRKTRAASKCACIGLVGNICEGLSAATSLHLSQCTPARH